jgi:hypothetical protein
MALSFFFVLFNTLYTVHFHLGFENYFHIQQFSFFHLIHIGKISIDIHVHIATEFFRTCYIISVEFLTEVQRGHGVKEAMG